MNENFESAQARRYISNKVLFEGKQCAGKFLSDVGHKMTTNYFQNCPLVLQVKVV